MFTRTKLARNLKLTRQKRYWGIKIVYAQTKKVYIKIMNYGLKCSIFIYKESLDINY